MPKEIVSVGWSEWLDMIKYARLNRTDWVSSVKDKDDAVLFNGSRILDAVDVGMEDGLSHQPHTEACTPRGLEELLLLPHGPLLAWPQELTLDSLVEAPVGFDAADVERSLLSKLELFPSGERDGVPVCLFGARLVDWD